LETVSSGSETPEASPVASPALLPTDSIYGKSQQRNPKYKKSQDVGGEVAWLATGDAVDRLYKDFRDEAEAHALRRNVCFTHATAAYTSGRKSEAKALSREGQEHDMRMKELHAIAAAEIFHRRNSGPGSHSSLVDLHGLHPEEAVVMALREARGRPHGTFFYLAIGLGKHSSRSGPKVSEAVMGALTASGVQWESVSARGEGGLLKVHTGGA